MSTPVIGMQIPWKSIAEQYFRIKHFTALAKVENGKVISSNVTMPYALVEIESPILPNDGSLPVVHRLDFYNLWRIFEERTIRDDEEVIVVYSPPKGLAKLLAQPKLILLIYPRGSLERIYDPQQSLSFLEKTPNLGVLHGLKGSI